MSIILKYKDLDGTKHREIFEEVEISQEPKETVPEPGGPDFGSFRIFEPGDEVIYTFSRPNMEASFQSGTTI